MSRVILLTQGMQTVVDDEDYEVLSQYKWRARKGRNDHTWYVVRTDYSNGKHDIQMHRQIMNDPYGCHVDHEDGNGLNNCRSNLRVATPSQNQCNRPHHKGSYKGVSFDRGSGMWRARIMIERKMHFLGRFTTAEEAAAAYDDAAVELHGEFATTNQGLGLLC